VTDTSPEKQLETAVTLIASVTASLESLSEWADYTEAHDIERKVDREKLRQAVNELLPKLDRAIETLEHFTKAPVISLAEERRRQAALANMLAEKDEE
jgi:hypothetical protein